MSNSFDFDVAQDRYAVQWEKKVSSYLLAFAFQTCQDPVPGADSGKILSLIPSCGFLRVPVLELTPNHLEKGVVD